MKFHMKKNKLRIFSFLLALLMVVNSIPMPVRADVDTFGTEICTCGYLNYIQEGDDIVATGGNSETGGHSEECPLYICPVCEGIGWHEECLVDGEDTTFSDDIFVMESEKDVSVWYFNSAFEMMEEAESVELYRGGELYVSAYTQEEISGDIQWQIEVDEAFWVDIQGGISEDLRISYGMVKSLLRDDAVRMRCVVSSEEEYYSDPFTVIVTDVDNRFTVDTYNLKRTPVAPEPLPAPVAVFDEDTEVKVKVTESTIKETIKETESETKETVVTEAESTEAVETEPETTESVETEPETTESVETEAESTEAVETEAESTEAVETEPETTEAVETEPETTESVETEPETTESVETEAESTEAVETEAESTESVETEPETTESVETEPETTESVETEPETTESVETEPETTEAIEEVPVVVIEEEPENIEDTVVISEESVPLASFASLTSFFSTLMIDDAEEDETDNTEIYTITIEYKYTNETNDDGTYKTKYYDQLVAQAYIEEYAAGSIPNGTVASPECMGYEPNIKSIDLSSLVDDDGIKGNITKTVYYSPSKVSYTVRHYKQNVDDDEYTWVDTTLEQGYTESLTSDDVANTYTGFTQLSLDHEEIAADNSTTIDIYYDRNYHLMSFELDGGYGVDPIYARYGTPISINTPSKTGWTFKNWEDADGNIVTIPNTMPNANTTYYATWYPATEGTKYSVVYWVNNSDGSRTYITSKEVPAQAGAEAHGGDTIADVDVADICVTEEHSHTQDCFVDHAHTKECFSNSVIKIGDSVTNASDLAAMYAANGGSTNPEGTYLYFIQTQTDKNYNRYWPKLLVDDQYYDITINGNNPIDQATLNSVINGNSTEGRSGKYYAYKYAINPSIFSCHSCGKTAHTHNEACKNAVLRYLKYAGSDTDENTIIVVGDGSTVVNVYYEYKEYELIFYYARTTGGSDSNGDGIKDTGFSSVQVAGGSTEYFGTTNSNDDATLLNSVGNWGTVTALPELKSDIGVTYTKGGLPVGSYTYHYISFKVRYNDNLSSKWPCDVFEPATRSGGSNNGWSGTTTFLSAWTGEHHVRYTRIHANGDMNLTIKGLPEVLNEDLLFHSDYTDAAVVSYLAFWENGTPGINWNVPELYVYNVWLPYFGEETDTTPDGKTIRTDDGKKYYLYDTYGVCDDSRVSSQTTPALTGYSHRKTDWGAYFIYGASKSGNTYTGPGTNEASIITYDSSQNQLKDRGGWTSIQELTSAVITGATGNSTGTYLLYDETLYDPSNYSDDLNHTIYREAYFLDFYYDSRVHRLKFYNHNTWLSEGDGVEVAYGTELAIYEAGTSTNPGATARARNSYPSGLEANVYEFVGWYTTAGCREGTEVDWSKATMPDSDLTLYAKWALISHEVKIYSKYENETFIETDLLSTRTVIHNQSAGDSETQPTRENYDFQGWFYKDENGVEQVFSFNSTPVTQDIKVYAKWRGNVMKKVEIYYLTEVADGENGEYSLIDDGNGKYSVVANANGNMTMIADTESLMLRLGQVRTFDAKTGNSLFTEYRIGCFPMTASHSITPTEEDINNPESITYAFVYKKYMAVPYMVEFYVEELDGTERPAFQVDANGKAVFVDSTTYANWSAEAKTAFLNSNATLSKNTELSVGGKYIELNWENNKAAVTELYVPENLASATWTLPDEYLPSELRCYKVIVPSETDPANNIAANTIKFVYTYTEADPGSSDPSNPGKPSYQSRYLVQHYIQHSSDANSYDLYSYSDETGLSGTTVTAEPISIPGYAYSPSVTKTYMDTYNDNRDWNKDLPSTQIEQFSNTLATEPDAMSGTITADDKLELNFYYNVKKYPYRIMYLEAGTDRVLLTSTTHSNDQKLEAYYGSQVTYTLNTEAERALLDDYNVDAESKSIYIDMEAGDTANINTIKFYFTRKSAALIITKAVELDKDQANEAGISALPESAFTQEFVFTVTNPKGFYKSVYDCIITDKNGVSRKTTAIAQTTTLSVKLKAGESIRIQELDMGTYTVKETYVPGFRITVNNGSDAQQREDVSVTAQLVEAGGDVTVNFVNSYPFYTGDLVLGKTVAKVDNTDPDAEEPYKVTVTLNPSDEAREVDREITWTDADGSARTFLVPALTGTNTDKKTFSFDVWVPVDGTITLSGVPAGGFIAEETVKGTVGYISDYYKIKNYSKSHNNEEEVTSNGSKVTGEIHGGHPVTVTFNNTYKKGNLTIVKNVTQEYVNDSWTEDTFNFKIEGTTELPDGEYSIKIDGAECKVTVTSSKLELTGSISVEKPENTTKTIWSSSLAFENLPAGYYTVTEMSSVEGLDQYTMEGPSTSLLVDSTETVTEAEFTNTFKRTTGNLQVGKTIRIVTTGSIIDTEQDFTFVVEPKDGTLSDSYSCTVKTTNDTADSSDDTVVTNSVDSLSVVDGKLTFTLKHNQYILIEGLPVGNYFVKEEPVAGYDSSFGDVSTNPGEYSVDSVIITTDNTTVLNCQNSYPVYYSNLIVKKTLVTPAAHSAFDQAPADDIFTFTVNISNYSDKINLTGGIGAKFYENAEDTTPEESTLTVQNDELTFTLKAGEWVDINLPACDYIIAESGLISTVNSTGNLSDHYTTSYTVGETDGIDGESYTIISGEEQIVEFTNTYRRHLMDLVISTSDASGDQNHVFKITGTDSMGFVPLEVVLNEGNGFEVTVKDLPVGTYTVKENSDWSWRYSFGVQAGTSKTVSFSIGDTSKTAAFTSDYEEDKWLTGLVNKDNNFNGSLSGLTTKKNTTQTSAVMMNHMLALVNWKGEEEDEG